MTREEFIDEVVSAMEQGSAESLIAFVRNKADLIYDPLLDDDDDKQFLFAARAFESSSEQLYWLAESLRNMSSQQKD